LPGMGFIRGEIKKELFVCREAAYLNQVLYLTPNSHLTATF